jgi:hypothetical protein
MDIKIGDKIFLKNQYGMPTSIIVVAIDKWGRYECKKGLDTYMLDKEFIVNNVVNKKVKYMNFIEAYKALVKGNKLRRSDWDKGEYIKKDEACGNEDCYVCNNSFSEEDGTNYEFCDVEYLANDWELYEE